jgi:uncharacterized protein YcfL
MAMQRLKIKTIILTGMSLLVIACSSTPKTTQFIESEKSLKTEPTQALQIINPASKVVGTANNLQIQDIRTSSVNNQLVVQVEVKNARGRRDVFDYRIRWLDANGLQVIPYAAWDAVSLEGQEMSVVNFISPRVDATDFRFEVKAHY